MPLRGTAETRPNLPCLGMVRGMSDQTPRDKLNADRRETDEWMFGNGSKVLAGVLGVIVLWFIVTRFW